jgi:hypothetical protein
MKSIMTNHIDQNRWKMFQESTNVVKQALKNMAQMVKTDMQARKQEIVSSLEGDYCRALLRISDELSAEQRSVRNEVERIISDSENGFKCLINPEAEPGKEKSKVTNDNKPGERTRSQSLAVASKSERHEDLKF